MASTTCFLHHHVPSATASRTVSTRATPVNKTTQVICKAQNDEAVSRRLALTVLIGGAALAVKVSPADAAYGQAANVFGKPKTNTDFQTVTKDGFKIQVPSKWNPSKEVEYPGTVLRFEDNFDATSNVSVIVNPTDKKSIKDFGPPEEFLSKVDFLLGKQSYFGKTDSEGGFEPDAVATANILETATPNIGGKDYYNIQVLTRTADGDEGGKHLIITATVSDGKLYICKAQAGDKRWFKGAKKFVESTAESFSVA